MPIRKSTQSFRPVVLCLHRCATASLIYLVVRNCSPCTMSFVLLNIQKNYMRVHTFVCPVSLYLHHCAYVTLLYLALSCVYGIPTTIFVSNILKNHMRAHTGALFLLFSLHNLLYLYCCAYLTYVLFCYIGVLKLFLLCNIRCTSKMSEEAYEISHRGDVLYVQSVQNLFRF